MMDSSTILDAVDNLLQRSGMRRVSLEQPVTYLARVFESAEVLVGVVVFETSAELVDSWTEAEDTLARFASQRLDAQDPKAWDLYLILATGDRSVGNEESLEMARIDTKRARKLIVMAGDRSPNAVLGPFIRRQLAGLIPIPEIKRSRIEDPVEEVARVFGYSSPVPTLVAAYASGEPLMPQLQRWLMGKRKDGGE
jgi:hypothetical protein